MILDDDDDTRRAIERKARLFDIAKERAITRIIDNVRIATEKLKAAEKELLEEAELEFCVNPFASILDGFNSGNAPTDDKVKKILSQKVPKSFGPDEESFRSLLKEIDSFKTWEKKGHDLLDSVPKNIRVTEVSWDAISLAWDDADRACFYEVEIKSLPTMKNVYNTTDPEYTLSGLKPKTEYYVRVRAVMLGSGSRCVWSNPVRVLTKAKDLDDGWRKCSEYVDDERKYVVDVENPRIAIKTGGDNGYCTIIGNTPPLLNKVTSWSIKILKSKKNDGCGIYIGVAPSDINQNENENYKKCGWYLDCFGSTLVSGPPHKYRGKEHFTRKGKGKYVHTGDSVGVVIDTAKGELSFIVNGVNLGVAYEGIPLDKPLAPCVLLRNEKDAIEIDTSEVKENVDRSIPVPSNFTTTSTTWDSITLTWNVVEGVSFYQVEVDGNKFWDASATNSFTKRKLLPDTEHTFRVRVVRGNSVSEWSDVVKGKTSKELFEVSFWKGCPDNVKKDRKYSVDEKNPRIATKIGENDSCTIIGNTPLPPSKVTSWSIKVLKSKKNDGRSVFIGVAPSDINQNERGNSGMLGWYFDCYGSTLCSGPPHKYKGREYGPRRDEGGYVHTGDSVGVVMDTAKGELSFYLNGVNLGVAYKGIPLDKSFVPFVLLKCEGDSVELDTSEVKENADSSINISNITAKSITWDSITLTWDGVEGASFYLVEMNGNNNWNVSTTNTFIKIGLLPDTEHTFRVRAVKGNSASEWSDVKKGRTQKMLFEYSRWKECPSSVDMKMKYSVNESNPRTVTKNEGSCYNDSNHCTIIGNTPLPLDRVILWRIKVLHYAYSYSDYQGSRIYIGVAPSDINQDERDNSNKCGWYFDCYNSALYSGPPHSYKWPGKEYGPRKEKGKYVHTGDSVGVVMDTAKGELSFVLNGVSLGVAYGGIPLDKPLVPCVLLEEKGDSVELDTSEAKENVDSSIPVPSNITANSATWDSITLTWNYIYETTFYQIEVNGRKPWILSTTNTFTKRGLLPETEHTFRIRGVKGNSVGEWSGVVKRKTQKESFETSAWKECPDDVRYEMKYSLDANNTRVAKMIGSSNNCSCVIGNTPLPPNKVTSWSIKVLKSKGDEGKYINVGIAPLDISQNEEDNQLKYGWYFDCYNSTLWSGPPHNYKGKKYGKYVYKRNNICVVMDTTKGELSFVENEVNLGVAYEGIPLDKPLVICALLRWKDDSVELDTSEVKENVDSSIHAPSYIISRSHTWDSITLTWNAVKEASFYQIEMNESRFFDISATNAFTKRGLPPEKEHTFRVRVVRGNSVSEWSDVVKGRTQKKSFKNSGLKECLDSVEWKMRYSVHKENPRIVTKIGDDAFCTIIGSMPLPLNKVTSWSIKILKSKDNNGSGIYIGVAPSDIDQNEEDNRDKCGWYFVCYGSGLWSGPPHNYKGKKYGQYVYTRNNAWVVMDTAKGELSFVVNGVNLGVAYEGIPLDKPLVPCVLLLNRSDSVELDTSEVKENAVDSFIPVPSSITSKRGITWDSITLTWDAVEGTSFYQIEEDGNKFWDASISNKLTKRGLLPDTEHTFRVRAVRGNSVSEWSDVVKEKTQKESFETSGWKECPDHIKCAAKYYTDEVNTRVARIISVGNNYRTIIGNTPLPLNKVTSWSIKILESRDNNGGSIYIGIAPSDINQNEVENCNKCGWYFDCFDSTLLSGPPHNYREKEYDPRKERKYHYVRKGTNVGVVMDTTKGSLSFVLDGMNCGAAYEGIPLNKPLVPCVILFLYGDSVELDTSEVRENVDSSIPVPSNIATKSFTWDSITLAWDAVYGASFYQIEVDRSIIWIEPTKCLFTKRGLLPSTEHTFRVRVVKWNSVSGWSDAVKIKTLKKSVESSIWKECPGQAKEQLKYIVTEKNPRIAAKITEYGCCTVIGCMPLPPNKVTSWSIKILKSMNDNGDNISIGVAPFDINQCEDENYKKCGWYFGCFNSALLSGPPHNYNNKEYGPRKEKGEYVRDGDSVGVVMDTAKGELSFALNGMNLGVAYEGIPLDKPLVPCVLLEYKDNSIELII